MTSVGIDGNQRTLVSASDSRSVSEARLAVGSVSVEDNNDKYLTGTGPFVYFIDGNTDVKYVNGPGGTDGTGTTTTLATGAENEGPVGAADRDGDSQFEIVYVDATNNDRLAYADPQDGTVYITDGAGNRLAAKPSTGAS